MPTLSDRLSALTEAYCSIFGLESELPESAPDYQLLSEFARHLDDVSSLVSEAFRQMNPQQASGRMLDLLLPQYGLRRLAGETDDEAFSRIGTALPSIGRTMAENIIAEVKKVYHIKQVKLFVNDTDATDDKGIPSHSICLVAHGASLQKIAEAIFRKKSPGIGTYGNWTKQVVDEHGVSHDVQVQRSVMSFIVFNIWISPLEGMDDTALFAAAKGLVDYLENFDIGQTLIVPSVYGVLYAAAGEKANTFGITDMCATASAAGGTTRIRVPADWNVILISDLELVEFSVEGGQSGTWFHFSPEGERIYDR